MSMDGIHMRNTLNFISNDLRRFDIESLKFLLVGSLPKSKLENDTSVLSVFASLEERAKLSPSNPWLLIEILRKINREDLVEKCYENELKDREENLPTGEISDYRLTLFDLALEMGRKDKEALMNHFRDKIPKLIGEQIKTTFDLMIFLEEKNVFSKNKMRDLSTALSSIGRHDLARILQPNTRRREDTTSSSAPADSPSSMGSVLHQFNLESNPTANTIYGLFKRLLQNRLCKTVYEGIWNVRLTKKPRRVFKINGDPIISDLWTFKKFLDKDKGIWVGVSDPRTDQGDYINLWDCSLWIRSQHCSFDPPKEGEEITVVLSDMQIYQPSCPAKKHTICNFLIDKQ